MAVRFFFYYTLYIIVKQIHKHIFRAKLLYGAFSNVLFVKINAVINCYNKIFGGKSMTLLEVKNLKKIYTSRFGGNQVQALSNVTFSVEQGEYVAIMGESGSGKTTLLNILASLDKPTSGEVLLDGNNIVKIKDSAISNFRRDNLGFVFQDFNLLDTFSLQDNIFLPLVLSRKTYKEMSERLKPIAIKLGIEDILNKFPYEVSGGQKQRAAIARALITNPKLVLADEPTGALDSKASMNLLKLFSNINAAGQTVLMVTHSAGAASHANRVMFIKDGEVFNQIYRGAMSDEEMYQKISATLTVLATGGLNVE
jgi:putative ABC transport system ATP-binding protein